MVLAIGPLDFEQGLQSRAIVTDREIIGGVLRSLCGQVTKGLALSHCFLYCCVPLLLLLDSFSALGGSLGEAPRVPF